MGFPPINHLTQSSPRRSETSRQFEIYACVLILPWRSKMGDFSFLTCTGSLVKIYQFSPENAHRFYCVHRINGKDTDTLFISMNHLSQTPLSALENFHPGLLVHTIYWRNSYSRLTYGSHDIRYVPHGTLHSSRMIIPFDKSAHLWGRSSSRVFPSRDVAVLLFITSNIISARKNRVCGYGKEMFDIRYYNVARNQSR